MGLKKFRYEILQMEEKEAERKLLFMPLRHVKEIVPKITPETVSFRKVYEGDIKAESVNDAGEKLFARFNTDLPDGYTARSLSISDIIVLTDENGKKTALYTDLIGFAELPEWDNARKDENS